MKFWLRFKRILKNSVITGIPQIVVTKNVIRKVIKLLVFTGCIFGFFWQTSSFLEVYWTYPTVVDVQYTFPYEFELPALTICSYNGIKSNLFCEKFPELCHPNKSLSEFCEKTPIFCDQNFEPGNESFPAIAPHQLPRLSRYEYRDMGMQPSDLVKACLVYDFPRLQNCSGPEIVNVFDTKSLPNNCYSYNSQWGKTKESKLIKSKSLFMVILKSDKAQTNQFYTGTPFALQLSLHNPRSIVNPFMNGFTIKPCSNYYIFPSKQVSYLKPPPYTSRCYNYSKTWYQRFGKSPLDKRLCSEECRLNKSMERFGCVSSYFIKYPNMAPMCSKVNAEDFEECAHFCRQACYREDISVDVQEHPFAKSKLGIVKEDECNSLIIFSFNRMEVLEYRYSEKYQSVSLFSYIGGYLGLWLGISLVAICDVIETTILIVQWIFQKVKLHQRNNRVRHKGPFKIKSGDFWTI